MTEAVLDASVLVKWFRSEGEKHLDRAHALRSSFEAGDLLIFVPPLIDIELINVAGRRWRWSARKLVDLAMNLSALDFERVEPEPSAVAVWCSRGLTAYDSSYVAVAEKTGARLVTADAEITEVAAEQSILLADWSE